MNQLNKIAATFTTKDIILTEHEFNIIRTHGGVCLKSAEDILTRSAVSFDDIERLNNHSESHNWGSNADRKYRKAAINKAIKTFAASPLSYLSI